MDGNAGLPEVLRQRVLAIRGNPSAARAGRRLVQENLYQFRGFPPVTLDLFRDWTADPLGHRSWQWQIASFNFMPWLIAYDAASADVRAMAHALEAVRSWSARFADGNDGFEFAWHDHATAMRALNALWLLCHLRLDARMPEAQAMLEAFLARHADRLAEEGMYTRHTNHGIDQSRVLGLLGLALAGRPGAGRWLETAMARLAGELEFAFGADGVHVENSPAYHQFVGNLFDEIASAFTPEQLGPLGPALERTLPKALEYMAWIVRPDGLLPAIGDTEQRPAGNVFRRLAGTPAHRRLDWVTSGGREGEQPEGWLRAFEDSGYLVARSDWSGGDPPASAFHLVLRSGFRSRYHRHDDDLSLCLYWGGDWLLDSGMHNYVEHDPVRRYLRSKWAHNVPVPEGFAPDWKRPASDAAGGLKLLESGETRALAEAWSASWPGFRARRRLALDLAQRRFEVEDSLEPEGETREEAANGFLSLWHLPADKEVVIGKDQVRVLDLASGRELRIEVLEGECEGIRLLDPGLPGQSGAVISRETNALEPAQLLAFHFPGPVLRARLGFRLIEHRSHGDRLGPEERGRRLFRSYCIEPGAWWPEDMKRASERVLAARESHLRRRDCGPAQLAEELHALAVLRQRSRRPTVYLTGTGGAVASWLEGLLTRAAGMVGASWIGVPGPLVRKALTLPARDRAILLDAVHLLYAGSEGQDPLRANVVRVEPLVREDLSLGIEPQAVLVLLCGDPMEHCLGQLQQRETDAAEATEQLAARLERAALRTERILRWALRQRFALRFTPAQVLRDPAAAVAAICKIAGAPLDTDRLRRVVAQRAAHAPGLPPVSTDALPEALLDGLRARFAPYASLWTQD